MKSGLGEARWCLFGQCKESPLAHQARFRQAVLYGRLRRADPAKRMLL
jgi:hypothetical protein